jgi:hypothetical protein
MTRMRSIVAMIGVLVLGAFDVPFALAQTRDPAAGEALFQEGRRLMKARDFAAACPKFEESQRLDPAAGTLLNLADCEEQLGRAASAWQHWLAAADQLPAGDKRRATALARASAIEKTVARLSVSLAPSAPANAFVKRDGVVLGSGSLGVPLPVDPGRHVIVVSATGREDRETEVTLRAKEQRTLLVEAGPVSDTPLSKANADHPSNTSAASAGVWSRTDSGDATAHASPGRRPPIAGYALLGVGVAGVGIGTYFGLSALAARRDAEAACPEAGSSRLCSVAASEALDRDKRNSLYADIAVGIGIGAAAAGLYLLLKPQRAEAETTADIAPLPGGGEVRFAGHF